MGQGWDRTREIRSSQIFIEHFEVAVSIEVVVCRVSVMWMQ